MRSILAVIGATAVSAAAYGQVMDPFYASDYTLADLGAVPGVPTPYGGLTFLAQDSNVLLIGGLANQPTADIFQVRVARDPNGSVSSFVCGTAQYFAEGSGLTRGIDGGLTYGPGGVLFYTSYNDNVIGQLKPGSTTPDRLIELGPLGIFPSVGTLMFVPPGFAGAGRLKIASYSSSQWHDATVTPDGSGTYNITNVGAPITGTSGPEGIVYVQAGNPGFAHDSVLVSEYGANRVSSFEIDANGDPIAATRRTFVSGLSGAEGATIDPATGDFLFSTFVGGSGRVIRVTGFSAFPVCVGDLNNDDAVTLNDLALLLSNFGFAGIGDLDGSCVVDLQDLTMLLAHFGQTCP